MKDFKAGFLKARRAAKWLAVMLYNAMLALGLAAH
jgi:hypothetical protein